MIRKKSKERIANPNSQLGTIDATMANAE